MSATPGRRSTGLRNLVPSLVVSAVLVAVDLLTKEWALGTLADREPIHVVWTLQWNLAFNSGMAFGRAQGFGPVIAVVATVVVVVLLVSLRREENRWSVAGVGLIIGGAVGNLLDRVFRGDGFLNGSVVDFIDFQWFPIFNVADMGINVGGAILVIGYLLKPDPSESGTDSLGDGSPARSITSHESVVDDE